MQAFMRNSGMIAPNYFWASIKALEMIQIDSLR